MEKKTVCSMQHLAKRTALCHPATMQSKNIWCIEAHQGTSDRYQVDR